MAPEVYLHFSACVLIRMWKSLTHSPCFWHRLRDAASRDDGSGSFGLAPEGSIGTRSSLSPPPPPPPPSLSFLQSPPPPNPPKYPYDEMNNNNSELFLLQNVQSGAVQNKCSLTLLYTDSNKEVMWYKYRPTHTHTHTHTQFTISLWRFLGTACDL